MKRSVILIFLLFPTLVWAQEFPSKLVRITSPYSNGSGGDSISEFPRTCCNEIDSSQLWWKQSRAPAESLPSIR